MTFLEDYQETWITQVDENGQRMNGNIPQLLPSDQFSSYS